tara:strand:- start:3595 stop:4125 length:531 start_codon:yes stop_codon:yes gene_type:complete
MEKRLKLRLDEYMIDFKDNLKQWVSENNCTLYDSQRNNKTSEFLQFVYDYKNFSVNKEDFQKRKRVTNVISYHERCNAKRANGEQCTRRKKDGCSFCGTHIKGTPHGVHDKIDINEEQLKKIEIWVQEIKGINYYIDSNNNVYSAEDVLSNVNNPCIIAKWSLNKDNEYCIPNLNI